MSPSPREIIDRCLELPVHGSFCPDETNITIHRFEDDWWMLWNALARQQRDLGRQFKNLDELGRFIVNGHGGTVLLLRNIAPDLFHA